MKKFLSLFLMSALLFAGCDEDPVLYDITVTTSENGTATADIAKAEEGTTITLTATPDEGYTFAGWTVVSGGVVLNNAKANPATFTMPAANVEFTAAFTADERPKFTVTVNAGSNGTASASVAEAVEGTTVTLTASPDHGYLFDGWTVVSSNVTLDDATANPATFTMPAANVEFTAAFTADERPKFTVTVNAGSNGTASASVAEAVEGTTVTLTASPDHGYLFDGWTVVSSNVTLDDATANLATFEMPAANVEFTAAFTLLDDVYTVIEDEIWLDWLHGSNGRFDSDKDGKLSVAEAAAVATMNIPADKGVESLKGIEYFTGLTRLQLTENRVSSLDLSKLTKLEILLAGTNSLTELDLTNNPALTQLTISYNQITSLNLSNQTALTRLMAYDNDLTSLDLSANTLLTQVDCADNVLNTLILPQSTTFTRLLCYGNSLTSLDLSKIPSVTAVMCYKNQLSSLNLSANAALISLSASENNFTTIDVSACPNLEELTISDNELSALNLSGNQKLLRLAIDSNNFTTLDISAASALENLHCGNNQLASLDVSGNPRLYQVTCANNGMTSFTASDALTYLECQNNNMTTLDLSIYTKLNTLKCYNNRLSTLDASNMSIVEFDGYYGLFCGNQKNSSGGNQTLTLTLAAKHLSEWNNALKDDINNVNVVLQ